MKVEASESERERLMIQALELRYEERLTWEEVARRIGVARSTLAEWRGSEQWKRLEQRKRALAVDEARGESSQVVRDAIATLYDLMMHSENERIRLAAAQKLIDINQLGSAPEEATGASDEHLAFLQELGKRKREAGEPVPGIRPGGLVPASVEQATEAYRKRIAREMQKEKAGEAEEPRRHD